MAGGYGKRMWPVTKNFPKSLLPLGGRRAIDYVLDKLLEADVDAVLVSTNLRFRRHFEIWLNERQINSVEIVAEASMCEGEKLGAIGALAELTPTLEPDDYYVIAGDNIFTSALGGMTKFYKEKNKSIVALYNQKTMREVKLGSVVTLDEDKKIIDFEEKPKHPKTKLVGACIYAFPYDILLKTQEYIDEGGNHDEPGNFITWLCKSETVYGYMFGGRVWDIGTLRSYEELKEEFSRRATHQF